MKCPVCQAQLLPVDGELFCLQCGEAVHQTETTPETPLNLEDTSDPLLRRAIADATDGEVRFRDGIVVPSVAEVAAAKPKRSFSSLRTILEPATSVTTGGMMMPVPSQPEVAAPPVSAPIPASPVIPASAPVAPVAVVAAASAAAPAPVASVAPIAQAVIVPAASPVPRVRRNWLSGGMVRTWAIGVAGLVIFVGANLALGNYFSNKVYPGVRAGNLAVGGLTFDELHGRLSAGLTTPKLAAVVDGHRYELDANVLGTPSFPELERSVKEAGRSTSLPIAGLITSLFSKPIDPVYSLSDEAIARAVQKLQATVGRNPSNAVAMIVNGNPLVLAEKTGTKLDGPATAAALKAAYGHAATATLEPVRVQPAVTAEAYANDLTTAQTMMGLSLQINLKKAKYAPTPAQIGGWLVFNGAGKGLGVDAAGVAGFVGSIPGAFDRVAAVNGLVAALNAHQGTALSPSTKKAIANPKPASTLPALPVVSYTYCVKAPASAGAETVIGTALNAASGWGLGGRVAYSLAASDCSFAITIGSPETLKALDPACEKQTSCRIHNELAIAEASWAKVPAGWAGDLASYRTELVNHIAGQWLGFNHPACSEVATQTPVLSSPSVIIPGCSPKWYAVPDELQDAKVLAGF